MALRQALEVSGTATRTRFDAGSGRLVGSRCEGCGTVSWPARAVCQQCGQALMVESAFASHGTLVSYTTVWVDRPGIKAPYRLGQVKLGDGPMVFAHVRCLGDDARVPLAVRLVVAPDENALPRFWVEPLED